MSFNDLTVDDEPLDLGDDELFNNEENYIPDQTDVYLSPKRKKEKVKRKIESWHERKRLKELTGDDWSDWD